MYLNITSKDESQDEQFIYNFTDINILQELKRIDGVGRAEIMGQKEYPCGYGWILRKWQPIISRQMKLLLLCKTEYCRSSRKSR